jgi:hypothetical protein
MAWPTVAGLENGEPPEMGFTHIPLVDEVVLPTIGQPPVSADPVDAIPVDTGTMPSLEGVDDHNPMASLMAAAGCS